MKFTVYVIDSYGNETTQDVVCNNVQEARFIGRNLHIIEMKYQNKVIPVISTEVELIEE